MDSFEQGTNSVPYPLGNSLGAYGEAGVRRGMLEPVRKARIGGRERLLLGASPGNGEAGREETRESPSGPRVIYSL